MSSSETSPEPTPGQQPTSQEGAPVDDRGALPAGSVDAAGQDTPDGAAAPAPAPAQDADPAGTSSPDVPSAGSLVTFGADPQPGPDHPVAPVPAPTADLPAGAAGPATPAAADAPVDGTVQGDLPSTTSHAVPTGAQDTGEQGDASVARDADGSTPSAPTDAEAPAQNPSHTPADVAPTEPVPPAPPTERAAPATPTKVTGAFEAFSIGDPGRAFTNAVSLTETKHRDAHDIVIDAATVPDPDGTPRLVLRGASSRGLAHQQYGDPRQDDHCTVLSRDGEWLVCLVADGVSAGEWSHLAAKMATEEGAAQILTLLETHAPHEIPYQDVFRRLADLFADICAQLPDSEPVVDLTPKEVAQRMATTLVIGIVATRPDESGTHEVTVVRLGDSSAWVLDAEDGWIALGDVKNAGNVIAESATACLPLVPDAPVVPVRTSLGDGGVLVLVTDGIGDPLGSGAGEVGRELARLWARPPHPVEFAAQVAFGRKTFDDDRGAIAVWPVVPE